MLIFTRALSYDDFYQGARPDGGLAVPPELEAYFSVDAQVQMDCTGTAVWIYSGTGTQSVTYRSEKFGTEKSTGFGSENICHQKKVLVLVLFNILGTITHCWYSNHFNTDS